MFPLVLAVLNRDYRYPYYIPYEELLETGQNIPSSRESVGYPRKILGIVGGF